MRNKLFILILFVVTLSVSAQNGSEAYTFLRFPTSTRANALGGHTVALVERDPSLIFHNPALLGAEMDGMINLNYMNYKEFFRPELMGRLDETVLFDPLGPEQLAGIADRLLVELEQRAARQGYTLHHTPAAAKVLAGDKVPPYGARELRRTVSRAVEQALADRIAAGTAHPGTVYTADVDADGHIILTEDTLAACHCGLYVKD